MTVQRSSGDSIEPVPLDGLIRQVENLLKHSLQLEARERLHNIARLYPGEEYHNEKLRALYSAVDWWPSPVIPLRHASKPARTVRPPKLDVPWEPRREIIRSSFRALLYGPVPPKGWPLGPYFSQSWVQSRVPRKTLALSGLFHLFVFIFPLPAWMESHTPTRQTREHYTLTYYAPVRDLPPLAPPDPAPRKKVLASPVIEREKPPAQKGADAFHPRQIILSNPPRPTHPRQTLIQPAAPPDAPKILPPLPNIVLWNSPAKVQRPQLQFDPSLMRVRRKTARVATDIAAPELQNHETTPGALNIAASAVVNPQPKIPLAASAVPRAAPRKAAGDTVAPDVGPNEGSAGGANGQKLIALSATPAPPAPEIEVPSGNLAARLSISPDGPRPGSPESEVSGAADGNGGGTSGGINGATGPPGISIQGGDPQNRSHVSGAGSGIMRDRPPGSLRINPLPPRTDPKSSSSDANASASSRTNPAFEKYTPGAPPEVVLGPKRIYTLNVNMPNVNSVTGSWILRFAELTEGGSRRRAPDGTPILADPPVDLLAPVPLRKVDPKYPPALASAKVQGEVVLYAIIRRDGKVDSIQLVHGVEPTLDNNAIHALAQWSFRPAERRGVPVELEVLVYIPFRAVAPF